MKKLFSLIKFKGELMWSTLSTQTNKKRNIRKGSNKMKFTWPWNRRQESAFALMPKMNKFSNEKGRGKKSYLLNQIKEA